MRGTSSVKPAAWDLSELLKNRVCFFVIWTDSSTSLINADFKLCLLYNSHLSFPSRTYAEQEEGIFAAVTKWGQKVDWA